MAAGWFLELAALAALLAGSGLSAAAARPEVRAASASVADIQAAVDQLPKGGTVRVPEGRVEAVGTITLHPGIRLIGTGAEKTVLFRGPQTGKDDRAAIVVVTGEGAGPTQLAGLGFIGVTDPASVSQDYGVVVRDSTDFRIDHCRFERFGFAAVSVRGRTRGVVDHCRFVDNFKRPIDNLGYGVAVYGTGAWREDARLGSADAVFVEDCEFTGSRHAVASNGGAHYVFRHNHVWGNDDSQAVDAHGPGYGSAHGTQLFEVYDNLVEKPIAGQYVACFLRGGGGVVFHNTILDYRNGIALTLDFDQSIDWSRPYPIPEQIGQVWCWDNTQDGKPTDPVVPERSASYIQVGRDYFTHAKPGYTPFRYPHPLAAGGPFDGRPNRAGGASGR